MKVKDDGTVKVLDFGLAKALDTAPEGDPSQSPTLTAAATQMGVILGTAAYMSPEQARGKTVDKRADIWSFGVVFYEMLTGQRAFQGEDVSLTLASVMKSDLNVTTLPPDVPATVRTVLRRCLAKDPSERIRDIGDVRLAMKGGFETTVSSAPSETGVAPSLQPWQRPIPIALMVFVSAALVGLGVWNIRPSDTRAVVRFANQLPNEQPLTTPSRNLIAVQPDGGRFVYNTTQGLYVRSMDALEARAIPGIEATVRNPTFSPDGQWLAYFSITDEQLKKIALNGGASVTLTDADFPYGLHWETDDTILYGQASGVMRVSANGGLPEVLVAADDGEQLDSPQLLPGGEWVLFSATSSGGSTRWEEADIVVYSLESGERRVLIEGGADARYVPTGHLVYALGDVLFAVAFDLARLQVIGGPVPMVQGVARAVAPESQTGTGHFGLSNQGSLVYVSGGALTPERTLAFVDQSGRIDPLNVPPDAYLSPRLSPDGRTVAVQSTREGGNVIWTYDLSNDRQIQQLTFEGDNHRPIWTSDGERITFASDRDGTMSLYWQPADGSERADRLTTAEEGELHWPGSWSSDGEVLTFMVQSGDDWDVWTLSRVEGGWEPEPLFDADGRIHMGPELSPDGNWLAYFSGNVISAQDVYVEPFPPTGQVERISQNGGYFPFWSRGGSRLFYRAISTSVGNRLRSVDIETRPSFRFTNESLLSPEGFSVVTFYRDFDVTANGERFLMIFPSATDEGVRPQINVVLNWFQELTERVPTN